MNENLINKERTWKTVICLNPSHETLKFKTNDIGDIKCPTCKATMIVEIKFMTLYNVDEEYDEFDESN